MAKFRCYNDSTYLTASIELTSIPACPICKETMKEEK